MTVSHAKMARPIEMPYGMLTCVSQRNHILDGVRDPSTWRGNFEGEKAGPGHAVTCPDVHILKVTRHGQHQYGADADWVY